MDPESCAMRSLRWSSTERGGCDLQYIYLVSLLICISMHYSVDLELIGLKSSGNRSLNMAAALANGTNNNSLSNSGSSFGGGMRPAMSLAQLCDLTPEEAPSSHRLIAQWESLIKKNAEGIEAAI